MYIYKSRAHGALLEGIRVVQRLSVLRFVSFNYPNTQLCAESKMERPNDSKIIGNKKENGS
jgi:hypothetical protein